MKYVIKTFVFDTETLLLTQEGEVIAFRINEAKLLALLLSDQHRLFSKEEILDKVWSGKVVGEQAVFQNIRNLRVLFGEESIKTYSKKGYQWQLPFAALDLGQALTSPTNPALTVKTYLPRHIAAGLLLGCLLLLVFGGVWLNRGATSPSPRVALLPLIAGAGITSEVVESLGNELEGLGGFKVVRLNNRTVPTDFFWIPQKHFPTISAETRLPYVLVALIEQQREGLRVRYLLKSDSMSWRAEHAAPSVEGLAERMNRHLQRVLNSGLLEVQEQNSELLTAKLKLLQSLHPQDPNLGWGLINLQLQGGDAASARVLSKALQEKSVQQRDNLHLAKGHLAEAKVYVYENLLEDAQLPLAKAESAFLAADDWNNLVEIEQQKIAIAFAQYDYEHIQRHVERALEYADRSGDVIKTYRLYTWAAVLGHKFDRSQDSHAYLNAAKAVLDRHHRDAEYYGLIHFYAGMFEQDEAEAEAQYRKVLELIPADQLWWERERAQAHLSELLVKQSRWQDALGLYENQVLDATQELLVGNIWLAQRDWAKAETHGVSAFEKAELNGQRQNALDAAAYLLKLDKRQQRPADNFYRQFLLKEAANLPHWIRFNKPIIDELGLELNEAG